MPVLSKRPAMYEVTVTVAGEAVKFEMPTDAQGWAAKVRTAGGKVKMSTTGTEGEAISSPYSTLVYGEGYATPDIRNVNISLSDVYFDDNGGTVPCVVELVVA